MLGDSSFLPVDLSVHAESMDQFHPIQAMESDESL